MTRTISWGRLLPLVSRPVDRLTPYDASDVALYLGDLARWCLRPEVLRRAAEDDAVPVRVRSSWLARPQLQPTCGACSVVFATDPASGYQLLRHAFVLPLRWIPGARHSELLPRKLTELADRVLRDVRPDSSAWGLQWGNGVANVDANQIVLECNSGWASLAAGLLVALEGGVPKADVWASGCWEWPSGVRPVDHLKAKLELASEWEVTKFFVPGSQAIEIESSAQGTAIQTGRLEEGRREPSRALGDLLWALEAPPRLTEDPESFARCAAYYRRIPAQRKEESDQFYREHLLPRLADDLRRQIVEQFGDWAPTHLVTIVSVSPNLVRLMARSLGVKVCLLLHTPDEKQRDCASALMRELESAGITCRSGTFPSDRNVAAHMAPHVESFLASEEVRPVVFDLTPGTKHMSLALARLAHADDWLVYLAHRQLPDGRPIPGSESLRRWRAGEI